MRLIFSIMVLALFGCSAEEAAPVSEPQPKYYSDRGERIALGFGSCGFCHGANNDPGSPLSGGRVQYDTYGAVTAANITPSETGIRGWTSMELLRLFRANRDRDDNTISRGVHRGFEWMSDNDTLSVISYLRTQPPVEHEVERRDIDMLDRNTTGILESEIEVTGFVPDIEKAHQVEYGRYLVDNVAHCGYCHSTPSGLLGDEVYLGGGKVISNEHGEKVAPSILNIEQIGIGAWSEDEIVNFLNTGEGPGNLVVDPNFCPIKYYRSAPPEDQVSVAKYLKSNSVAE